MCPVHVAALNYPPAQCLPHGVTPRQPQHCLLIDVRWALEIEFINAVKMDRIYMDAANSRVILTDPTDDKTYCQCVRRYRCVWYLNTPMNCLAAPWSPCYTMATRTALIANCSCLLSSGTMKDLEMDISRFPFDSQTLEFELQSTIVHSPICAWCP
jgi:hypothetical protein